MEHYLELELLIVFSALILTIGGIIVYKDRANARKAEAEAKNLSYNIRKAGVRKTQRSRSHAERQRMARRRVAQQQMKRQEA